jgi:hypothetical protein
LQWEFERAHVGYDTCPFPPLTLELDLYPWHLSCANQNTNPPQHTHTHTHTHSLSHTPTPTPSAPTRSRSNFARDKDGKYTMTMYDVLPGKIFVFLLTQWLYTVIEWLFFSKCFFPSLHGDSMW